MYGPRLQSSSSSWTTYSDVEARKKGDVSRNAFALAAPRASSDNLPKRIVVI